MSEFKFPDEVEETNPLAENEVPVNEEVEAEDSLEVEIVDDTPVEDQGRRKARPLPPSKVKALEEDDGLEEFSDKVKERLVQMKKVWHDERRAKESATREREEAINYARAKELEVQSLRERLGHGEQVFVAEIAKSANGEIAAAKERMKRAYEAGDADMIADAQEELTDAKFKLREIQSMRPSLQPQQNSVQQQQTRPTTADPKAEKWRERNTWFGVDEEMTSLALGLHEKLVRSGIDPRSDDYYERVDATMKQRFPENFDEYTEEVEPPREQGKPVQRAKPATIVAPVTRTSATKKSVTITRSGAAIARRLGITPEAYAREVRKLENYNG